MKEKHKDEIHKLEQKHREERQQAWLEHQNKLESERKKHELTLICEVFDCNISNAESIYNTLHKTLLSTFFIEAENNTQRKEIYEKAKNEEKKMYEFHIYAVNTLMPIIISNKYDIELEYLERKREIFEVRQDIPIEDKLLQLHNTTCSNYKYLYEALNPLYPNAREIFPERNFDTLSENDIFDIAKCFNNYFAMNLSEDEINLINIENLPRNSSKEVTKTLDSLQKILAACLEVKNRMPQAIYMDVSSKLKFNHVALEQHITSTAYTRFIDELFFSKPYYSLKNYEEVIRSNIDILEETMYNVMYDTLNFIDSYEFDDI